MSLYEEWKKLLETQTEDSFDAFWEEYSEAEKTIYTYILEHKGENLKGSISELSEKFGCRPVIFEGFLDGITTSLNNEIDAEPYTEDTEIELDVDYKKLYFNMLKADAPHLFSLKAWDEVISEEERAEITKEYKRSKTYIAPRKIGRNEPCPCGSGKKYKNCCGKAQ